MKIEMKNTAIVITLLFSAAVWGQDFNEKLVVPLSDPSSQGRLDVGLIRGDINVEMYNGTEVIIQATAKQGDCDNCDDDRKSRNVPAGMKRIASSSVELSASESNNRVKIETNSWKKAINLEIKVPKNFDLKVSTVHGKVSVSGVSGAMEVSAVHGPLTFADVSGSIICNTVHGDIISNFEKVSAGEPMSFVTLHGNVDITFPASVKATTKMKSDRGEIFTDFDMTVDKTRPEVKTKERNEYKVSINSWVYGDINGGGPEFTFKNMHGDIIIRKQ